MWQAKTVDPNFFAREATNGNAFMEGSEKSVANRIFLSLATGRETTGEGTVAIWTSA
jgi:hypothetical protein